MTVGLLEKESTGGAIARVGFEYQDAYVLQSLPRWLSQSAFSHVVSEAVGDVEVCYYGPQGVIRHFMLEAKNHELTSTGFWEEVQRFKTAFESAPREFVRFGLVCRDYNSKTSPFVAMLARLRGVGTSYHPSSTILLRDRQEVIAWAEKQGVEKSLAEFALQYIDFEVYASESADSAFSGEVERHLTSIDLSGRKTARLRDQFKVHIANSSSGPVFRHQLEADICEILADDRQDWLNTPTRIVLTSADAALEQLILPAAEFVGPTRSAKVAADWQHLSTSAQDVADFLSKNTERRTILLDGRQGMSAACILGHAFRATKRFVLHVEHNGTVYRTDAYDGALSPFFQVSGRGLPAPNTQGAAVIAFTTGVGADLTLGTEQVPDGAPVLTLESGRAVASQADMTLAVNEAKTALVKFRSEYRLELIHLFIKGPSAFSMLLGHRLNGICQVQLYDWVDGSYRPTASLLA